MAPQPTTGPWPLLHPLGPDHLEAVLAFELENRSYFARSVTDRGDGFYEHLADSHRALLAEQAAGTSAFYVLLDGDGSILGRFNLYDLDQAVPHVGYRVAERAVGRGVATRGLQELCRRARGEHGVRALDAETSMVNVASQRVLEKAGFVRTGTGVVGGKPGLRFTLTMERP